MVGIVLASHGEFATGIKQSGSMVFGDQENVCAVTLMPSEGPDDFRQKLADAVASFDKEAQEEVLFLVDLWGGTPFNQCSAFSEGHDKWAIVTGLNLPMLIEAYTGRFSLGTAHEIATKVFVEGRRGVRVKPEELQPKPKGASAAAASRIPRFVGLPSLRRECGRLPMLQRVYVGHRDGRMQSIRVGQDTHVFIRACRMGGRTAAGHAAGPVRASPARHPACFSFSHHAGFGFGHSAGEQRRVHRIGSAESDGHHSA